MKHKGEETKFNCNENLMKHVNKMKVPKKNTFRKSILQWALKLQNWQHKMNVSEMNKTNNMRNHWKEIHYKGSIIKYEIQISLELGCVLKLVLE
jgi:hypothetical protein